MHYCWTYTKLTLITFKKLVLCERLWTLACCTVFTFLEGTLDLRGFVYSLATNQIVLWNKTWLLIVLCTHTVLTVKPNIILTIIQHHKLMLKSISFHKTSPHFGQICLGGLLFSWHYVDFGPTATLAGQHRRRDHQGVELVHVHNGHRLLGDWLAALELKMTVGREGWEGGGGLWVFIGRTLCDRG